jgi:hypothetical protein
MGFLKDFAMGFATQEAKHYEEKKKITDDEDAHRRKRLVDLDVDSKLNERKLSQQLELERQKRKDADERMALEMQTIYGSPQISSESGAQPTPQSDFDMMQYYTAKASAAKSAGLDDDSAGFKLKADVYQQRIQKKATDRDTGRQPTLTAEGISGSKAFAEREQKRIDSGADSIYLPETVRVGPGLRSKVDATAQEKALSAKAQTVYGAIESASADETTGRSNLPDAQIEILTQKAVKLHAAMTLSQDDTQKEQAAEEYTKLLMEADSMKSGLSEVIKQALGDTTEEVAEPVNLSTDRATQLNILKAHQEEALAIRSQFLAGKITAQQAKEQLQMLGQ